VNKRGDTYYVFWYDDKAQRTERKTLGTKDPAEARKRLAEFLGSPGADRSSPGLTVPEALDAYYREHVSVKCVAVRRRESAIAHLKHFFKTTRLSDIDIPMSRMYVSARRSGATVWHERTHYNK